MERFADAIETASLGQDAPTRDCSNPSRNPFTLCCVNRSETLPMRRLPTFGWAGAADSGEAVAVEWGPDMSGNNVRLQAIKDVEAYVPPAPSFESDEAPGEIFGENVFSMSVMQKRLPKLGLQVGRWRRSSTPSRSTRWSPTPSPRR